MNQTTLDILVDARALLAEGNWIRGRYRLITYGEPDCFCAVGAVRAACGQYTDGLSDLLDPGLLDKKAHYYDALDLLDSVVPERYKMRGHTSIGDLLIEYNDAESTTLEGVLSIFDAAIEKAKSAA